MSARRLFLGVERLEDRSLMANDLYINTHPLWGGEVQPGDQNVVVAEFQMIGRLMAPMTLKFESEIGAAMRGVALNPEVRVDLYGRDGQGRLTLRPDGNFETLVGRGIYDANGDVSVRLGGIGMVLAHRGVPLQLQVDVSANAEDGMPIAFSEPTVGFLNPRLRSNVHYIGYDNPVYMVNGIGESHVSFDLTSPIDSLNPGDDDIVFGTLNVRADEGAYVHNVFVGFEGRHRDGSVIADVDRSLEDFELRDIRTGQTYVGIPVAEVGGLEIVRFENLFIGSESTFEIRADQEGVVASGDRFRTHVVVEPSSSANQINIAGLTGPTTDYRLQATSLDWNDRLIVSPGGILSGNFRKVEVPQLNVTVKSIGVSDTAVKNEDNINLLRFEVYAGGEDLLFTQASFVAEVGTLLNVQDATLWFDSDRDGTVDTIAQSGVSSVGGQFRFDNIIGGGILIPDEESVLMEVHADVASSLTTNSIRLDILPSSVEAEDADSGASLASSQIVVNSSVDSKLWNFVNQGDLFVTLDSTPVRSRHLLGGTLSETAFRLQFRAQNEPIDVTDLQITSRGSNASSVDRLELYRDGATTPFATATVSGAGSDRVILVDGGIPVQTFVANMENGQLVIPEGETLDVLVRVRTKSDEQGALSGQQFQLFIGSSNVSDNATGEGAVRARGRESSSNLAGNDGDALTEGEVFIGVDTAAPNREIVSNRHTVVLSKFTSVTNANPDADNTNVPTGVSPFAQFKFTAAANSNTLNGLNKAALDSFVIYVDATNVLMDAAGFTVYNKADSSTKFGATVTNLAGVPLTGQVTGQLMVRVMGLSTSAVDAIFESGEVGTLVLEGNILNSKISASQSSSLQGSLSLTDEFFSWFDQDTRRVNIRGTDLPDTRVNSTRYRS